MVQGLCPSSLWLMYTMNENKNRLLPVTNNATQMSLMQCESGMVVTVTVTVRITVTVIIEMTNLQDPGDPDMFPVASTNTGTSPTWSRSEC